MTDSTGNVVLMRQYDAWGNLEAGATEPGYAFTAREWDPETGLYYYRARYYDPKVGRFISEDPIGFWGGVNFYAYVHGRPTVRVDPYGFAETGSDLARAYNSFTANVTSAWNQTVNDLFGPNGKIVGSSGIIMREAPWVNLDEIRRVTAGGVGIMPMGVCNVGGGATTAEKALENGARWLGPGYKEIAPGVFRSADEALQFRMTTSDLIDPMQGPHVHFEAVASDGRTILENSHVGITNP
jgi:RHS repeat-associated protein